MKKNTHTHTQMNAKEEEIYLPDLYNEKIEFELTQELENKWKAIQRRTERQMQELVWFSFLFFFVFFFFFCFFFYSFVCSVMCCVCCVCVCSLYFGVLVVLFVCAEFCHSKFVFDMLTLFFLSLEFRNPKYGDCYPPL